MIPLFLVALGLVVAVWNRYHDWFAPGVVFAIGWLVPWAVAELQLSEAQDTIQGTTTGVLIVGSVSFFLGLTALRQSARPAARLTPGALRERIGHPRLRVAMGALLLLSIGGLAVEAWVAGTLPILAAPEVATAVYRAFPLPFIHYATISSIAVAILAVVAMRAFAGTRSVAFEVVVFIVATAIIVALMARMQIAMIGLGALIVMHYTSPRGVRMRWLAGLAIGAVGLFIVLAEVRGLSAVDVIDLTGLALPDALALLAWPYLYVSLNFTSLQYLMNAGLPATLGANVLQPILSLTLTRRLFPVPNVEEEFGWFNTYTFLWPIWSDFRWVGVVAVPFCYGLLMAALYRRLRARPDPAVLCVYALGVCATLFLFQSNPFSFTPLYVLAAEFALAFRFARAYRAPAGAHMLPVPS
jgi:oligosaccharide repeat unit polymerase